MSDNKSSKTQVFFRVVKAEKPHPFAGLYAVEKVFIKANQIYKKEIVHEWDLRILSEAALAKLGGSSAYEAYKEDNPELEEQLPEASKLIEPRTADDLKTLTKNKLTRELKLKEERI